MGTTLPGSQLPPPSKTGSDLNFPPPKDPSKFSPQFSFLITDYFYPPHPIFQPPLLAFLFWASDSGSRGRWDACPSGVFYKCSEKSWQKSGVQAPGTEPFQRDCVPNSPKPFVGLPSPSVFFLPSTVN